MPPRDDLSNDTYYHASPECWSVYTEVLAAEYSNAVLFGQVHQRTVDAYAVQHAGGAHPDKSVAIHLAGLYLVIERGVRSPEVPPMLQRLASSVETWPHFEPPRVAWTLTIFDVATASDHIAAVRAWSELVWKEWAFAREEIAALVARVNP